MATELPEITFVGGLVEEPEFRVSPSGVAVATFRLASKKRVRDQSGQWVDGDPIYLQVTCFKRVAEHVAESLRRKGQRVIVVGRLEQQWWNDRETGEKRNKFVIIADNVGLDLTFSDYDERPQERPESAQRTQQADPWGQQSGGQFQGNDPWGNQGSDPYDEPPF